MSGSATHWPQELKYLKAEKILEIAWDDGRIDRLAAELLRVESPSAEVQGHGPHQKTLVPGRAQVGIIEIEPVGHYAVRLKFDDLHDTGIYSWAYLRELGDKRDALWAAYLTALAAAGLSREPKRAG